MSHKEMYFLQQRNKSDGYSISSIYRACNWEKFRYSLSVESLQTLDEKMS